MKKLFGKMVMNKTAITALTAGTLLTVTATFTLPNLLEAKKAEVHISVPEKVKQASKSATKVKSEDATVESEVEEVNAQDSLTLDLPKLDKKIQEVEQVDSQKETIKTQEESKPQEEAPKLEETSKTQDSEEKEEVPTAPDVEESKTQDSGEKEQTSTPPEVVEDEPQQEVPKLEEEPKTQDSEIKEQVPQTPEVVEDELQKEEPKLEEESRPQDSEEKEQAPQTPEVVEDEPQKEEPKLEEESKTQDPEVKEQTSTTPEVVEDKPQQEAPKLEENSTTQEPEVKESSPTEEVADKEENQEDLLYLLKNALQKTMDADSAYYITEQSGLYDETLKIKYNKGQNREWIVSDLGEDYLEGIAGRYTNEWHSNSSYYNQSWWRKRLGASNWESEGRLHSSFGISILRFLYNIKEVKEYKLPSGRLAFRTFIVTIDKDAANKAGETQFNKANMFKEDIQLDVSVDHSGYIVSMNCDWDDSVLSESIPNISYRLRAGNFNSTTVQRPEELRNVTIPDYPKSEELTATKKREIASQIEAAYEKTTNAESATYKTQEKEVQFNKEKNEALIKNQDGTTYYKGTDGMYTESDYVAPSHHQDSWTKSLDSDVWKQNVRKHTAFNPKELYFLNHIFDVTKVEKQDNLTTYTVTILKYDANVAYNYASNQSGNKFEDNITFTVTLDEQGYIRRLHIHLDNYQYDLEIDHINETNVSKPLDL